MAGTPNTEKPITWDWVKMALPLVIILVGIVTAFVTVQTQMDYHETRICALESKAEKNTEIYTDIQTRLAEIQRDLSYLRRDLDRQNGG